LESFHRRRLEPRAVELSHALLSPTSIARR
jgi:hypothetical protein